MAAQSARPATDVDFLVIGSGVAGLTYALDTSRHGSTLILTKKDRAESNSNYAQGGIAGVMGENDDIHLHAADTLIAGAGICHEDAVEVLVSEGPDRIRDLMRLGAAFNTETGNDGRSALALGREGGHSRNRIVHAVDRTGWECERTLLNATKDAPDLQIYEHYYVVDLAVADVQGERRCVGAYAVHGQTGEAHLFRAKAVLLATGGCGRVYLHTTNPAIATGDGVAMAWRAGAAIANMEFIQFHPTALYHERGESYLISEAVRGEGGILRTADGSTFMERYHPSGALAPRDVVARAIHAERLKRGDPCVFLDVTHLNGEYIKSRFPTIYRNCLKLGIDITQQPIPVVPAAHYMCGGVQTDLKGQTTLPGLYAAGEVACTGVHGANRLASNSLLEAMVFGHRAAVESIVAAADQIASEQPAPPPSFGSGEPDRDAALALRRKLVGVMDFHVGIVRNDADLGDALAEVDSIAAEAAPLLAAAKPHPDVLELRNMATVARLIIRCALARKESRGLHYTTDYPKRNDVEWRRDTVMVAE